jgi:guanylate kinase
MSLEDKRSSYREPNEMYHEQHEDLHTEESADTERPMDSSSEITDHMIVSFGNNKESELGVDGPDSKMIEKQHVACIGQDIQECSITKAYEGPLHVLGEENSIEVFKDTRSEALCVKHGEVLIEEKLQSEKNNDTLQENLLQSESRDVIDSEKSTTRSLCHYEDQSAGTKGVYQDENGYGKYEPDKDSNKDILDEHRPLQVAQDVNHVRNNGINSNDEHDKMYDIVLQDSENDDLLSIEESPSTSSMTTLVFDNKTKVPLTTLESTKPRPLVIAGPSGVGKTTLIKAVTKDYLDDQFGFAVTSTSRLPKNGEVEGLNYNFVEKSEMEKDISAQKFIEYWEVNGNLYGTSFESVEKVQSKGQICILNISIDGVMNIKKSSMNPYYLFIAPPSIEELETRLCIRDKESEHSINQRLANIKQEIDYGMKLGNFDNIIINNSLGKSIFDLKSQLKKWYPNWMEAMEPEPIATSSICSNCAGCVIS